MSSAAVVSEAPRARRDTLGIIAVITAGVVIVAGPVLFLLGAFPELRGLWFLVVLLAPFVAAIGLVSVVVSIVGLVVAAKRGRRSVLSLVGLVLGCLIMLPGTLMMVVGWLSYQWPT